MFLKHFTPIFSAILVVIAAVACSSEASVYPHAEGTSFVVDGQKTAFVGTNLWYAGRLAETEEGLVRLRAELDALKGIGITNLRVIATQGEDIEGLRTALREMEERNMYAVLFLNNTWNWTYGYREYVAAVNGTEVDATADTDHSFCTNKEAIALSHEHIRAIVPQLRDSKAIFSWQICNEPRCFSTAPEVQDAFVDYICSTAKLIKELDPNHMVSTGSEGTVGCDFSLEVFERIHSCPDIDYANFHIWPLNWSWISKEDVEGGIGNAIEEAGRYIDTHVASCRKMGKPLVLEEFGFPRDGFQFAKGTPASARDKFYSYVFGRIVESRENDGVFAGCNFWGWGGMAEQNPDSIWWQEGDDFCGDPKQEQQGLNSVYLSDESTINIIKEATQRLKNQ